MNARSTVDPRRAHLHGMWSAVAGSWREHADYVDARVAGVTQTAARAVGAATRRAGARAGLRAGRRRSRGSRPGRSGRRGRRVRRRRRDDVDRGGAGRRSRARQRHAAPARPRGDRRARRLVRRRPLPRGPHVRERSGPGGAGDPARAPARRPRRDRGVGPARAQPVARARHDGGERAARPADPAARLPRAVRAAGCPASWPCCCPARVSPTSPSSEVDAPLRAGSFDEWWLRTSALAGPLSQVLESLPEPTKLELRDRLETAVAPYLTPAGLEFDGVTLVASGLHPVRAS